MKKYEYWWAGSGRSCEKNKSFAAVRRDRRLAGMQPHAELYRSCGDEDEILVKDGQKEIWASVEASGLYPHA